MVVPRAGSPEAKAMERAARRMALTQLESTATAEEGTPPDAAGPEPGPEDKPEPEPEGAARGSPV